MSAQKISLEHTKYSWEKESTIWQNGLEFQNKQKTLNHQHLANLNSPSSLVIGKELLLDQPLIACKDNNAVGGSSP